MVYLSFSVFSKLFYEEIFAGACELLGTGSIQMFGLKRNGNGQDCVTSVPRTLAPALSKMTLDNDFGLILS